MVVHGNDRSSQGPGDTDKGDHDLFKDEELVRRAQEDDPWATEELLKRYLQKAYTIAYRMCFGDREEAEDLTQESFLRVFRNLKKFRGQSLFYTWFYRIVVNTCLDERRRHRRWKQIFSLRKTGFQDGESSQDIIEAQADTGKNTDPVVVLRGKQLTREVQKALKSLPEKQRIAFQLKVLEDMNIHEIAVVMGLAEGTVKSHLFRATQHMRKALEDWGSA